MNNFPPVKIFPTSGSQILANNIYQSLNNSRLPRATLGESEFVWFSNQNVQARIGNVRNCLAVVIHTQALPVSDGVIELFALLDAILNARPADVLLVFPYMPYSRSERKNKPRISVMAKRLAHILTYSFGIKRVILLDPHDTHLKHYFEPAADEISAIYLIVDYLKGLIFQEEEQKTVVVFADAGAAAKYGKIAQLLKLPSAYIIKERPDDNEKPRIKEIVGDIRDKNCLIVDDEILTGGTVINDAKSLLKAGAREILSMVAIHAVLASKKLEKRKLVENLANSAVKSFIITDSIPYNLGDSEVSFPKFTILSTAPLLAEAIKRSVKGESLTQLHRLENVNLYRRC